MRIFDRYIARQILVSTLFAVGLLSVVLVMGQIFKKLLDHLVEGVLPPSAVLKFTAYAFPMSLSYTIPWGLLTAVLLTFGRLSADNELLSMRMSGIGLGRICLPVFVVAGALSVFCMWINFDIAPMSLTEIDRLTKQAVLRDPLVLFAPDKTIGEEQLPGNLIYVGDRTGDQLKNVQIIQLQGDSGEHGRPSGMIFAKEGRLATKDLAERKAIELDLKENAFFARRERPPLKKEEREKMAPAVIAAREAAESAEKKEPPRIFDIATSDSGFQLGINSLLNRSTSIRVQCLNMGELRECLRQPGVLAQANPGVKTPSQTEVRTEYHKRISFSLACFVLALAGIPFGITAHRRETSAGFVLSLVVGMSYFSLIMLGSIWKDKPEKMPHLWVWLPNVIFGILGFVMFRRLQRK
jgi:lipopolysaccharide export LptBFGC system permease protein LptF